MLAQNNPENLYKYRRNFYREQIKDSRLISALDNGLSKQEELRELTNAIESYKFLRGTTPPQRSKHGQDANIRTDEGFFYRIHGSGLA